MLTIPNTPASPTAEQSSQSMPDQRDFDAIVAADFGTGVVSGCAATQTGAGAMSVDVAAGAIVSSGVEAAVTAATVPITTADATNPRFDIIVASSAGALSAVAGAPAPPASASAPGPVFPAIPAGSVLLASVYVRAATASVLTADIQDKRAGALDSLALTNATPLSNVTIPPGYTASVDALPYVIPAGVLVDVQSGGALVLDQGAASDSAQQRNFVGTAPPPDPRLWDRWFDTLNKWERIWNGSVWIVLTPQTAQVITSETGVSNTYADLATVGPSLSIVTGTIVAIWITARLSNSNTLIDDFASIAVTGASAIAANDNWAATGISSNRKAVAFTGRITGLTPGLNTFTLRYRNSGGGADTTTAGFRNITVQGVPS